ncbi:MAG TPA: hypothetical protein ENK60_00615 [Anaerolineae bacterium]|nr:hypothetical protein [Anaerolineae bacterium]
MSRNNEVSRIFFAVVALFFSLALFSVGCKNWRAPQVVKIGLIAPFEGASRPLGYDTLHGVKLRINQWNESGREPKIELVALNDDSDPELAARLPDQLAQDTDIRLILGPPQGHTAIAVLSSLQKHNIPTLLLAPVRSVPTDGLILPYAGIGAHYQQLFQPMFGILPPAWSRPINQPSIWLGDPFTLAELYNESPELVPAAGPVAGEEALQGWAPDLTWTIPWAAPMPENLPEDFSQQFEALAGKPPNYAAALAYAATDEAIRLITGAEDYRPDHDALKEVKLPPITVVNPYLVK